MNSPEVVVFPAFFASSAYIVWVVVSSSRQKARLRTIAELNNKLIDKIGSVQDFSALLQTEAGSKFMQNIASDTPVQIGPQRRILGAAQTGAVLVCLGLGLMALGFFSQLPGSADDGLNTVGVIALSLGVGFVVSAVASYRIARALGLLSAGADRPGVPATSEL